MTSPSRKFHPAVTRAQEQLAEGRISRREFLRLATLLGTSYSAALVLAACGAPTPAPTEAPPAATEAPAPTEAPASGIQRGGIIRASVDIMALDDPARLSWIAGANILRHTFEYLTETGSDNITRPYLLESWEANDELTMWTLKLRQGVTWSNGDELVAEHVRFNLDRWLNPDTQSSILGLWEGILVADKIEIADDHTLVLNLDAAKLDVPESLFHYPALIVHPDFDGDATSGRNAFTGYMSLDSYVVGQSASLSRREGYWQMGEDGQPLPYLDGIEYVDIGTDQAPKVAGLQGNQIDFFNSSVDSNAALEGDPSAHLEAIANGSTGVLRMRVDLEPWTDVNVRQSLKKLQERQKIIDAAFNGSATIAGDYHVAPIHPEHAPLDPPEYDPEGAKALLAEAGFPDGIEVELTVISTDAAYSAFAEVLAQSAIAGGWTININPVPANTYWDQWTELPLGITNWGHRPLGTMVLGLAYTRDPEGNPVPWNETRWFDDEFDELLAQARGTLDVEARRAIMADIEKIMQDRGPAGISFWERAHGAWNPKIQDISQHPTFYHLWRAAWIDPSKDPFA
jgi:peptide/nickel transport system substrate-binding protein